MAPISASSSSSSTTRWCPTPEQLMILEEMYRGGIRTPNATQIQQITTHLSYYGKIEGKNVFYWFQNHKARDRQKLRRKLSKQLQQQQQQKQQQQQQQNQQQNHQQNHHNNFLQFLDQSSKLSSPFQQFSRYSPPASCFLPQGGIYEDASRKVMNYTWKVDMPPEMEKSMLTMYGRDWTMMMMMMDVGPPSYCCNNNRPPLKTLELFPVSSTNLKEECNNTSKLFPCSTSTN